ncbi:uncharacterized protein LOC112454494 [Temnothorax curvispinosus]|uniref:Uncharacterized protein LOC112454494 n=1 Tax=Temnothorax curvispinosus TaxID=300111 RepID=A0A6J1PPP7_9HYME|nr:uncharacterized protein LOC112454494 [Temnothorax curvispinosus]
MESTENFIIYACGICEQQCQIDTINTHPCVVGYENIIITESNYFYPQTADGEVIEKGQSCVPSIMESTRQNIDTGNDNSAVTIASIEEMLIAAVQERPPLWNYKDFSASQRTKAIKDKLWQEIEDLLNTNKEKREPYILTREPREVENSDFNITFHTCKGSKKMNLDIFCSGLKTVLRGEITSHM